VLVGVARRCGGDHLREHGALLRYYIWPRLEVDFLRVAALSRPTSCVVVVIIIIIRIIISFSGVLSWGALVAGSRETVAYLRH